MSWSSLPAAKTDRFPVTDATKQICAADMALYNAAITEVRAFTDRTPQYIEKAGTIDLTVPTTVLGVGLHTQLVTLPDGTFAGQRKSLVFTVNSADGGGDDVYVNGKFQITGRRLHAVSGSATLLSRVELEWMVNPYSYPANVGANCWYASVCPTDVVNAVWSLVV